MAEAMVRLASACVQGCLLGSSDLEMDMLAHTGCIHCASSAIPQKCFCVGVLRFVFTDAKGMLYYFKTADDPPNYRGMIDIK